MKYLHNTMGKWGVNRYKDITWKNELPTAENYLICIDRQPCSTTGLWINFYAYIGMYLERDSVTRFLKVGLSPNSFFCSH